jgi:hypothetical protein
MSSATAVIEPSNAILNATVNVPPDTVPILQDLDPVAVTVNVMPTGDLEKPWYIQVEPRILPLPYGGTAATPGKMYILNFAINAPDADTAVFQDPPVMFSTTDSPAIPLPPFEESSATVLWANVLPTTGRSFTYFVNLTVNGVNISDDPTVENQPPTP